MALQQLSTISTLLLTRHIDTGDKVLDATLVSTAIIIITSVIMWFYNNRYFIYNISLFYFYRMWKNPVNFANFPPYIYNNKKYNDYDEFRKDVCARILELRPSTVNKLLKYITVECGIILKTLVNCNNVNIMCCGKCVYPLFITSNGEEVYLAVNKNELNMCIDNFEISLLVFPSIKSYNDTLDLINNLLYKLNNIEEENKNDNIYNATPNNIKYIGKVSKNKTFDTLFFTQKDELVRLLTKFNSSTLYPKHIPIDNKLGILLYGPPGTGKTGTISAIANMLKRNIITINFSEIRTCNQLDNILKPDEYSKNIYVFDEFDCILDALSTSKVEPTTTDWGSLLMLSSGDERKKIIDMIADSSKQVPASPINLAYLLQKLDGLESAEGRLIIATTNNPDKINPALLRPGRFDLKLCLSNCTSQMFTDILSHFYKSDINVKNKLKNASLPENKISPLELINAAIQTPNIDKLIRVIRSKV